MFWIMHRENLQFYIYNVNDTFMIWLHEEGQLKELLDFINSVHVNIKCMTELEREWGLFYIEIHFPFLYIDTFCVLFYQYAELQKKFS